MRGKFVSPAFFATRVTTQVACCIMTARSTSGSEPLISVEYLKATLVQDCFPGMLRHNPDRWHSQLRMQLFFLS